MLSKNNIKFINSLRKKKYRAIENKFIAEGEKVVEEIINSELEIFEIFATNEWIKKNSYSEKEIFLIDNKELKKIRALSTPNKVLAVVKIPNWDYKKHEIANSLSLILDNIRDPGNLGTIMRIADWFGISNIFCSKNSVDVFSEKVIQSTMGAICRTKVHYVDIKNLLNDFTINSDFPVYGTFLEGENIYSQNLVNKGFIIMGNESNGISDNLHPVINKKLYIPNFPKGIETSESLNISIATAIVCSEFRRRIIH
jgi:TrmH family RNA methyltransferase